MKHSAKRPAECCTISNNSGLLKREKINNRIEIKRTEKLLVRRTNELSAIVDTQAELDSLTDLPDTGAALDERNERALRAATDHARRRLIFALANVRRRPALAIDATIAAIKMESERQNPVSWRDQSRTRQRTI